MRVTPILILFALASCAPAAPPAETAPPSAPASTADDAAVAVATPDPAADAVSGSADVVETSAPHATLRGRVSYPSEELPAMRVCALATEDVGLGYCTETAVNGPHYELRIPPGTWILLAWPQDTGTEGAPGLLSLASDCLATAGLNCDDHGFLELTVDAGEAREGLDINDWYYPPDAPPLPMEPRGEILE